MLRHFNIGPAAFETVMVVNLVAVFLMIEAARRQAKRQGVPQDTTQNALLAAFFGGLIGARIGYGLLHWSAYSDSLGGWISLSDQGLHVGTGVAVAVLIALGFGRWHTISIPVWLDVIAPGLAVLSILIPLGFLAEGSVIGQPTDVLWGIELWGETRHPTQLYAMIGALLTLVVWWWAPKPFAGSGFLQIVAGNGLVWLLVGLLLAEPSLLMNYRVPQVLAWAALVMVAVLWNVWSTPSAQESS